jgi:hypothetical protein
VSGGAVRQGKQADACNYLLKKWHIVGASKLGLAFTHFLCCEERLASPLFFGLLPFSLLFLL